MYLNGLVCELKATGVGIDIAGEKVASLLYADDIALLAESEADLQVLLDSLHNWSQEWSMNENTDKTKIVHF